MSERPTAVELLEAARDFLERELLPTVDDDRLRFRLRVTLTALSIAARDLEQPSRASTSEDLDALARRIRTGEVREEALPLLKELVAAKLRTASPQSLDRYG